MMIEMVATREGSITYFNYNGINVFSLDTLSGNIRLYELSQKEKVELVRLGLQVDQDKYELIVNGVIH